MSTWWGLRRRADGPSLGRLQLAGGLRGPELAAPPRSSTLVVGPTQVGKTSGYVIPAILRWEGPVVVTSVKRDLVDATARWRATRGTVTTLEPAEADGVTWNPLEGVSTFRHALASARDLTLRGSEQTSSESAFWNAMATKLLGALFAAVATDGGDVFDVVECVARRRPHDVLANCTRPDPDVARVLDSMSSLDPRTFDATLATIDAMLVPWQVRQPLAHVRGVLDGAHTLYLCAPRNDQRHYEHLFRGALRSVLDEQQRRAHHAAAARLLVVLDEAASIAPLEDLDQIAATVSGLNVTLLSVFQDFAQMQALWGERAATVVNNHTHRVVLGGLADPTVANLLPAALDAQAPSTGAALEALRRVPRGRATLVSGTLPVLHTRVTPWFRQRALRSRGTCAPR